MKRLFLSIKKGEELRFLGHLDFLRTMERAIMRANIPAAFSEGFNPHMKVSFDAALAVGVTADPLYMELRLEKDLACEEVREMLSAQLPKGIEVHEVLEAPLEWPKFSAYFNEDVYEMEGPVVGEYDPKTVQDAIDRFNALNSFSYVRVTPKKVREMDIKTMILDPMSVRIENDRAFLTFSLVRKNTGIVQPKDIWKIFAESFGMPWGADEFICSRIGVYHREGDHRYSAADMGIFSKAVKG